MRKEPGKVYLVGAGPGDPSLITLRGFRLLECADVVFYDYLVDPVVLNHAGLLREESRKRELICLGRHGEGRILTQEEINQQIVAAASAGKVVVRLKGGDPAIFGRTAEEISAIESAGLHYEVIPGVTSGLAASSYSGIPLTHRDVASCVALITGQESDAKTSEALDLASLAKFPGTLVYYMGVTTARDWSAELISHGKSAETPVAIVRHCTFADQQVLKTTLSELGEFLSSHRLRPPAIIIVGNVVASATSSPWFSVAQQQLTRPLFGKTVLITRPEHQSNDLASKFHELGAISLCQPAIHIAPPQDWESIDRAIAELASFNWLVFSSANGVKYFLDRLIASGRDLRQLASCQIAAIGPATTAALQQYHLQADLQPEEYRAEALAAKLAPLSAGKHILLLRASRGREVLADTLTAAGTKVSQVVVYQSEDVKEPSRLVLENLRAGKIDWITVTSSAIARSLVQMFGEDLRKSRLAAISPLTAEVLSEAGFPATAVASEYTTQGLLDAIVNRFHSP
ncbi:uroporphyrinogen-III C-methyltransferase [Bythopirellula polymerisocia]|uniref:uroporphyrinogen-III C-methyltransferase n=1 Tax=Bythopirellula polymerisocia TaxID=2528003 RepID=A0A5C6CBK1_9BACT|nr:uroporphyrinogen-III C-methyltransferase [Bythopirellula polymerisocia]TWU20811.1 Uroporphyrinogen-III C-methyltransferase [Bythopirellula polymerisocia]